MNLKDLRNFVSNILDYNPDVSAYKQEVTSVLNRIYISHFTARPWEYAQKQVKLAAYTDITIDGVATAGAAVLSRNGVVNSGAVVINPSTESWVQQGVICEIVTPSTAFDGTVYPAGKEFIIATRADGAGPTSVLYLIDPVMDPASSPFNDCLVRGPVGADLPVKVIFKHRHLTLPPDLVDILYFGLRGRGVGVRQPFFNLPKFYDEAYNLNLDIVARPTDWIMGEPLTIRTPITEPSLLVGGRPTSVPVIGEYRGAYVFEPTGPWDPLIVKPQSAPIFTTATQVNAIPASLEMLNMEQTDTNPYPTWTRKTGLYKKIYIKQPASNKFFEYDGTTVDVDQVNSNTLAPNGLDIGLGDPTAMPNLDVDSDGLYQTARLYPRQSEDYEINIRYLYRPTIMEDDHDVPATPKDTHLFLAYMAISEIFYKHSDLTQGRLYEQKAQKELLKIENKYLHQRDSLHIKGAWKSTGVLYGRPFQKITRVT